MHGQYSGQLSDWRARCEAAEAKHAAANIQVQIVKMIVSGEDDQGGGIAVQIDNYQVETLQGLEREVARLQAEVTINKYADASFFFFSLKLILIGRWSG